MNTGTTIRTTRQKVRSGARSKADSVTSSSISASGDRAAYFPLPCVDELLQANDVRSFVRSPNCR